MSSPVPGKEKKRKRKRGIQKLGNFVSMCSHGRRKLRDNRMKIHADLIMEPNVFRTTPFADGWRDWELQKSPLKMVIVRLVQFRSRARKLCSLWRNILKKVHMYSWNKWRFSLHSWKNCERWSLPEENCYKMDTPSPNRPEKERERWMLKELAKNVWTRKWTRTPLRRRHRWWDLAVLLRRP